VLRRHPEIRDVLNRLAGRIDDRAMRRLNLEVAQQRRSEREVVREFLLQQGLVK
jgi:osmoprotectant transport system substrate-binding protein